jgi:hypothetical protein
MLCLWIYVVLFDCKGNGMSRREIGTFHFKTEIIFVLKV